MISCPVEIGTGGPGELHAAPGTLLARILGTENVDTPIFIRRFHFEAGATLAAS